MAEYLEERHAKILAVLTGNGSATQPFAVPDDGPEVDDCIAVSALAPSSCETVKGIEKPLVCSLPPTQSTFESVKGHEDLVRTASDPIASFSLHLAASMTEQLPRAEFLPKVPASLHKARTPASSSGGLRAHRVSEAVGGGAVNAVLPTRSSVPPPKQKKGVSCSASGELLSREAVIRRLYAKIGYHALGQWITARDLQVYLEHLTLETFDLHQMNEMVALMYSNADTANIYLRILCV